MAVRGTVDQGAGSTLVSSVTGTTNEVTASPTSGAVVVSLPAALTLTGKTLTGGTFAPAAIGLSNGTGLPYTAVTAAPIFVGTRITSQQTVTSGTPTLVQLNSSRMDVGGYYNAGTFLYTPLVAGKYEVSGSIYCSGTTIASLVLSVSKNGTSGGSGTEVCEVTVLGLATAGTQGVSLPASFVTMNGTTDTLELDVTVTGTGTMTVNAVRSATQMAIKWVGP